MSERGRVELRGARAIRVIFLCGSFESLFSALAFRIEQVLW